MRIFEMTIRIILGLMLLVLGTNKLFAFIPMPLPTDPDVLTVFSAFALMSLMDIVAIIEIIAAIMLLTNTQTGVALYFLAPVSFCAFLFHIMLDPLGIAPAAFFFFATMFLIYSRRERFLNLID